MTTPPPIAHKVPADAITAYREDGICVLRGVFPPVWVEHLRAATEAELAAPGPMALDVTRGGKGKFFANTFLMHHSPAFRGFVEGSGAAAIAAEVLGAARVNLLFDQVLVKEPGTETPTMWHHDLPYWPVLGDQVCTMWIALDEVTADSGAVEYIAGSHRWGKRFKAKSFTGDQRYKEDLPELPDIDATRDQYRIVQYALSPGDCTIHHGLTVHGAPGNSRADRRRRGYVLRWCGEDVVWHPRPNIQPMLRDPGLAPGAPIACDLFPTVHRAA